MKKIILASASPRRKEILEITGLKFSVCVSDYEEDLSLKLPPRDLARFLSRKKAETIAHKYKNAIIIAADTVIVFKNRILGKPHRDKEAGKMLRLLNGRSHSVITGFTILDTGSGKKLSRSVETKVYFRELSLSEIQAYVRSGEPLDKAGSYAIQGLGAVLVDRIEGDYSNVIGLPLTALCLALRQFGVDVLDKRSFRT